MAARHKSRERALQVLYQCDLTRGPVEDAIASFYDTLYSEEMAARPERDRFMEELAKGTAGRVSDLDRLIVAKAESWKLERMPAVDRNILRLAVYELTQKDTAPAIVIDEAVELARRFSGEESAGFINGVLDAVRRDLVQQAR